MRKLNVIFLIAILLVTTVNIASVTADGAGAVVIESNTDFATYAVSGDGSLGSPYVINDTTVASYGGYGIYIADTDAYCVFNDIAISGNSPGYGVYLYNVANVNFTGGTILNQRNGFLIDNCSTIGVMNVNITYYNDEDTSYGIKIEESDNVLVEDCQFDEMRNGIIMVGGFRVAIRDNSFIGTGLSFMETKQVGTGIVVQNNLVNGLPLGYLFNEHDRTIDGSGYGQLIGVSCVGVTVYDANITEKTNIGIQLIFCQNTVVKNSTISNAHFGIVVYESFYCGLFRNNLTSNYNGVYGYFAVGTVINENNFEYNTQFGLWAYAGCSSSMIAANNFIGNGVANARDDGSREDSNLTWAAGKFVNSVSGWPLKNVSVTVERAGRTHVAHTNEDGFLRLPVPALGTYDLTIEKLRYQTKTPSVDITMEGIHLFNVPMVKANLGPGTGYVQARFMHNEAPVEGVEVDVYSLLDGAYYFHSNYTSASGGLAGWVNITGLYYDNYIFITSHPSYEERIIQQVVVSDGLAGTYSNIELESYETHAFIYGTVLDATNELPLEGAELTIYDGFHPNRSILTNSAGFFNMTDVILSSYNAEIVLADYDTEYRGFVVHSAGSFWGNPVSVNMTPDDYVPEGATASVVNNWDNEVLGNYWDDIGGIVVLAADGPYEIPGTNGDGPEDEYPLDEPYVRPEGGIPTTTTSPITTPTTTTTPTEPVPIPEIDWGLYMIVGFGVVGVIAIVLLLRKRS